MSSHISQLRINALLGAIWCCFMHLLKQMGVRHSVRKAGPCAGSGVEEEVCLFEKAERVSQGDGQHAYFKATWCKIPAALCKFPMSCVPCPNHTLWETSSARGGRALGHLLLKCMACKI